MANYNLTQTGDEVQAYIDSIPVIDVSGTLSGSNIVLATNPYSQIIANYSADCGSVVRLTVGTKIYIIRISGYDGTDFTGSVKDGDDFVTLTIGSSAASGSITSPSFATGEALSDVGIDATPTQGSDNLVKSGGVYETLYGADVTQYENVGQLEYYAKNGNYYGWRGTGVETPLLLQDTIVNKIIFPPFFIGSGEVAVKYWVGYNNHIGGLNPSQKTTIATGTLTPPFGSFTLELDTPVTIPAGNAVYVLLYGTTKSTYFLGGSNSATTLQPYSADDARRLYLTTDTQTPFSVFWTISNTTTTAQYKSCSPILLYEVEGSVSQLEKRDDYLQSEISGADITRYENVGQLDYYEQYGVYAGWKGTGTQTPRMLKDTIINTIVFPPFKASPSTEALKYMVTYSAERVTSITPSNNVILAEGEIPAGQTDFTLTLSEPKTIPAGYYVFVFLYTKNGTSTTLGGSDQSTSLAPFSDNDGRAYYLTSTTDSPFTASWTGAVLGTTAQWRKCNPILKFVIPSAIEEKVPEIKDEVLNEVASVIEDTLAADKAVEVYLPDKLYAVVGDTMQIFFQSCVVAKGLESYNIYAYCSKGKTFARYYEYTPTADDIGTTTFTIYVKDNKKDVVLGYKTCELVTVAAPTSPATAKNIFTFGDSLTTAGQWVGEMKRRLVGSSTYDGIQGNALSNINFFGYKSATIHGQSVDYFGVGGWTWASYITKMTGGAFRFYVNGVSSLSVGATYTNNGHTFTIQEINITSGSGNIRCTTLSTTDTPTSSGTLTKASGNGDATITFSSFETENANPLWDDANNKFSFIPYVNNVGASTIDVVYVLLTWNSQSSWKEYSAEQTSGHVQNAKTFARTLHTEYPNAKLKIMGLQMPSIIGGLGANYGASGNMVDGEGMKQCAVNYNKAFQDLCNLDEFSPYCEFVDTATQFDTLYNMPMVQKNVNLRNSNVKEYIGTNGVHPTDSGYYQIADAVYRNFVANYCQG